LDFFRRLSNLAERANLSTRSRRALEEHLDIFCEGLIDRLTRRQFAREEFLSVQDAIRFLKRTRRLSRQKAGAAEDGTWEARSMLRLKIDDDEEGDTWEIRELADEESCRESHAAWETIASGSEFDTESDVESDWAGSSDHECVMSRVSAEQVDQAVGSGNGTMPHNANPASPRPLPPLGPPATISSSHEQEAVLSGSESDPCGFRVGVGEFELVGGAIVQPDGEIRVPVRHTLCSTDSNGGQGTEEQPHYRVESLEEESGMYRGATPAGPVHLRKKPPDVSMSKQRGATVNAQH